jgi:hypothetical protein
LENMTPNVGSTDRLIRLIVGALIMAAGLATRNWWGLVGLVPMATALLRWCPAYLPFRLSTFRRN